jgi:hypothetical protein
MLSDIFRQYFFAAEMVFLKRKLLLELLLLSWSRFWRFVELPAGRS